MKLKLTDNEFSLLADLVFAGNWVINSQRISKDIKTNYFELKEKLLKNIAKKQKFEVDCFAEKLESNLKPYFDFYADKIMLERLAERLSEYEFGDNLSRERSECEDAYLQEFAENGLKNIQIKIAKES